MSFAMQARKGIWNGRALTPIVPYAAFLLPAAVVAWTSTVKLDVVTAPGHFAVVTKLTIRAVLLGSTP